MLGKTISTKVDAEAVFVKALDDAISQATSAGVGSRTIIKHLEWRAKQLQPEYRPNLSPRMFDARGNPVDLGGKVEAARRARQRRIDAACEIDPSQRQVAASGYKVPR